MKYIYKVGPLCLVKLCQNESKEKMYNAQKLKKLVFTVGLPAPVFMQMHLSVEWYYIILFGRTTTTATTAVKRI
jgi:hypothetical protein